MIGTVGSNACWLGTLDLKTQHLHQQILSSNNEFGRQVCQNLILYDSNRIFALGHAVRGEGLLSDLDDEEGLLSLGEEIRMNVYGMVLDLRRVELSSPPIEQQQVQGRSNIFDRNLVENIFGDGDEVANTTKDLGSDAEVEGEVLASNNETNLSGENSSDAVNLTDTTSDEDFVGAESNGNLTTINLNETDDSVDSNSTTNGDVSTNNTLDGQDPIEHNSSSSQDSFNGNFTNESNQTQPDGEMGNNTASDDSNVTDPIIPPSEYPFDGNETDGFDYNTTDHEEGWEDFNSTSLDSNSTDQDAYDSNSTLAIPSPEGEASNSTNSNSSSDYGDGVSNSTLAPTSEDASNSTNYGDFNYTEGNSTNSNDDTDTNSTNLNCSNTADCDEFDDWNSTSLDDSNNTNYDEGANSTDSDSTGFGGNETDGGDSNYTVTNATDLDCGGAVKCDDADSTDLVDSNITDYEDNTGANSTDIDGNQQDSGSSNFTDTNSTNLDESNSTDYSDSNYTDTNSTDVVGNTTDFGDPNSTYPDCNAVYCGESNKTDTNSPFPDETNSTDFNDNTTDHDLPSFTPTHLASDIPSTEPTLWTSDAPTQQPTTESPTSPPTFLASRAPTREPYTSMPTPPPTENNNTDHGNSTPAPIPEEESPEVGTNSTGTDSNSTKDLIGKDGFDLNVKGGRILDGQNVYPLHITNDKDFVYVVSLEAIGDSDPNSTVPLDAFEIDSSKSNHLKVSALPVISTFATTYTPIENTLAAPLWETVLSTGGAGSIVSIGGIVQMGNALYVGGSTKRDETDLGLDKINGNIDGFISKLSKDTGTFLGNDGEPIDKFASYRVASSTKADDFVQSLCASPSSQTYIYVAGSSVDTATGNGTRAFLTKLRVTDLVPMWTAYLRAMDPSGSGPSSVKGVSCAVTETEDSIFFTGNVENGGWVAGSISSESAGGTDIFVAKIDGESGDVVFIQQIGSAGDDFVAPGKSISLKADGSVIVVGSSNGQLYGARNTSFSSQLDAFVAIITDNGSVPMIYLPPAPTSIPTAAPIENSQNSTLSPTSEADVQTKTFTFKGMTLRLEGARPLTTDSRREFENTIETFYREYYAKTESRRLQISEVTQFSTIVSAAGEQPDLLGNTIKYDQTVSFTFSDNGNVTVNEAKSIITSPFQSAEKKQSLLVTLRGRSDSFQTVIFIGDPSFTSQEDTDVVTPVPTREPESDSGVNIMLYFFIVIGLFGLCVFGGLGFLFYYLRRNRKRREAKENAPPVLVPTLDVLSPQGRRLSRAKNAGDYSAAYLTDLADVEHAGNRSSEFDYKSYHASGDFSRSFGASQDFSFDGSQEKIRVKLPARKGAARSSSRESFRQKETNSVRSTGSAAWEDEYDGHDPEYGVYENEGDQDFTEGNSQYYDKDYIEGEGQDYTEGGDQDYTEGNSEHTGSQDQSYSDSYNDEELQVETPKKSGIIADCFDTPNPEEQHSDSYNSFFEQFGGEEEDFPEPVPDLGMGIDSERGSSYRSGLDAETESHLGSEFFGSHEGSDSSDSEPHIKITKDSEDVSSFSGGESFDDNWAKGF